MADQWHYSVAGEKKGPISSGELKRLASAGKLSRTDLIWKEGMANWAPAGKVKGLFPVQETSTPPRMPPLPRPIRTQDVIPPPVSPRSSPHEHSAVPPQQLDLARTLNNFIASNQPQQSKHIWTGNAIPESILEIHKKQYLNIAVDEIVLVLLNNKRWYQIAGFGWSGLAITNKAIHYCVLKESFLASILPIKIKGFSRFTENRSLEIAKHDACLGTAYIGHELRINDKIIGYVRMGTDMSLDTKTLEYLNSLFNYLHHEGFLTKSVGTYSWQ